MVSVEKRIFSMNRISGLILTLVTALGAGCTGQIPGSLVYLQQIESSDTLIKINTKIDLLFVVDNSASMDVSQNKLREAFGTFATRYMKPSWDIRVAVIPTDLYMAKTAFNTWRNTVIPGTVGYDSAHISSILATWSNPSWNPTLVNLSNGVFTNGVKYGELIPLWGPNYAKLLPGNHDGPITALCFEALPHFLNGLSQCDVREGPTANTGTSNCLDPNTGETSITQCVNTVQNDTVRSGKAIIETKPPLGTPANAAWTQQLIDDFTVNLTTGSAGQGSERPLQSILQLLTDNEATSSTTKFFREDAIRAFVIVTDEEDQSMTGQAASNITPTDDYACDQAGLIALNPAMTATIQSAYCCTSGSCNYGDAGISCPSKTIDGYTYTPSTCASSVKALPIATVKSTLDNFFLALDTDPAGLEPAPTDPNYFVAAITPTTGQSIQDLQAARTAVDQSLGVILTHAADRCDRCISLTSSVGNGSFAMDINSASYTPILDAIGNQLVQKVGTIKLKNPPLSQSDMTLAAVCTNGQATEVPYSSWNLSGNTVTITDIDFLLNLNQDPDVSCYWVTNYQPYNISAIDLWRNNGTT